METKKLFITALVVIVVLNLINQESKKSFEKSVLEIVKNHANELNLAVSPPPPPAPLSEEEQLKQQLNDKVEVDIGNTPFRGSRNAKIKIVVFSDFQCPFSKRGALTVQALMQKYGNNIMFVHKNLPLPFHNEAMPSAKAALAAGKQGKFYEYHDKLYEYQDKLGEETYIQIAKELGLNLNRFNGDRNGKEIEDQIKADTEQANRLGYNGTPGFALNGVRINGAYPIEHFEKIINALGLG